MIAVKHSVKVAPTGDDILSVVISIPSDEAEKLNKVFVKYTVDNFLASYKEVVPSTSTKI